jgi:hypothetical protein
MTKNNLLDFREMIEHIPAVILRLYHLEDDWRTLFVTQNITMYGYTHQEFREGKVKWLDLVHPDDGCS